MDYQQLLREASGDPARLEQTYQEAVAGSHDAGFAEAVHSVYAEEPANLLYAAWHYRLARAAEMTGAAVTRHVPWLVAIALAVVNGLLLWLFSDDQAFMIHVGGNNTMPYFVLLWGPLAGVFVLAYLARAGGLSWRIWGCWWPVCSSWEYGGCHLTR